MKTGNSGRRGKIIFDMDGVITGENCYWEAAALVVWELLYAPAYLGLHSPRGLPPFSAAPGPAAVSAIRKVVFHDDEVISFLKRRAINSNWDLAFLTFSYQLVEILRALSARGLPRSRLPQLPGESFELDHLKKYGLMLRSGQSFRWAPAFAGILGEWAGKQGGLELMERLARRVPPEYADLAPATFQQSSGFWKGIQRVFQEWYFGEEQFSKLYAARPLHRGKTGLIHREEPVLPQERVRETLQQLRARGWTLGIATGRPWNELYPPLEKMKLWPYFARDSVATFTDVQRAEQLLKEGQERKVEAKGVWSLGKPHPFSFLKAYWAGAYREQELMTSGFPRPPAGDCWVIGDSMADLLAARTMGADFIGVLSGHNGPANESLFRQEGARAVFPDITHLTSYFY